MRVFTSHHHLDERVPGLPVTGCAVEADSSAAEQSARLARLYAEVAAVVESATRDGGVSMVAAADCHTSPGVLAGLQRAGHSPGIVWLDAHGDFNTAETSPSGYLGGMSLAIAVGREDRDLRARLGLTAIAEGSSGPCWGPRPGRR